MIGQPNRLHVRPHDDEDKALICRIAAGDDLAFDTLYQHYKPRLMAYLQPRLGQLELAEEVCQDVMLVVWQQAAKFDRTKRLSTWVLGIARNKTLMCWRAHAIQATRPDPPAPDHPDENPEGLLAQRERQQQMQTALSTLTTEERQLFSLVYDKEQPYRQIARLLGCPVNTIKTRIRRLRQELLRLRVALDATPPPTAPR